MQHIKQFNTKRIRDFLLFEYMSNADHIKCMVTQWLSIWSNGMTKYSKSREIPKTSSSQCEREKAKKTSLIL